MAKMGKMDSIGVTISLERNSNLTHRHRVVVEVRNLGMTKLYRDVSWYATLRQAVDQAAAKLSTLDLYRSTGPGGK